MVEQVPQATEVLVLISAIFVLMMTIPGLTLFYGSLVSRRNLIDTMLQSVVLTATIPIVWWALGYSLCFDGEGRFMGGVGKAFLNFDMDSVVSDIPEAAWCLFQMTFGVITAVISTGAVAERALLWPLMVIANLWLLVVYCPICHMVWGGGILAKWGVVDTAGGLVVETCSGVTALVLCFFVGPRTKEGDEADPARAILHIIGGALLWVGWLAFNGGSAYTTGARASMTMLNTFLAGSAGSLGWFITAAMCDMGLQHVNSTFHLVGGAISGLVAATPSSGYVSPLGSVVIGLGAGMLCYFVDHRMKEKLCNQWGIDDVVSVFPVHGMGGIWGTIMTGVFAVKSMGGVSGGVEGNWNLVGVQTLGVVVTCVWTCIGTAMLCVIAQAIQPIRSTEQDEHKGLDTRVHLKRNSSRRSNGCSQEVNDSGDSSTDAEEEDSYVSMPGAANA